MSVQERLAALEQRLLAAEDQLEIIQLLNTFGPLVDCGDNERAARLWVEGGAYDVGGYHRALAYHDLVRIWGSDDMKNLINSGCAHLTATPRITVNGETAEAVAYAFVILKEGDRWYFWRASINHWTLVRTRDGWRIKERFNRPLDGSKESHDTLRKVMRTR
jgi:hypothetical protein